MENFFMNSVGSALNCAIRRDSSFQFMVDMGAEKRKAMNLRNSKPYTTDTFMLSHYHHDHYNGIGKQKLKFFLKNVYLPKTPTIYAPSNNKSIGYQFLTYLLSFAIYTNGRSLIETVLNLLYSYSKENFKVNFVSKGDSFVYGKRRFEIMWPPKQIEENDTVKDVIAAIEAYEKLALEDPLLKQAELISIEIQKLFCQLTDKNYQYRSKKSEFLEKEFDSINYSIRYLVHEFYEYSRTQDSLRNDDLYKDTNDKLRKAANHLSIAFRQEDNILFLGDLEQQELEILCKELQEKEQTYYDIIIAPHHGTHWHDNMKYLQCDYALASVGSNLVSHIKIPELSSISKCFLRTDRYGVINIATKRILS